MRFLLLGNCDQPPPQIMWEAHHPNWVSELLLVTAATPHGFLKGVVASYKGQKDQLPVCNDRCKEVGKEVTLSSCSICSGDEWLQQKGLDPCLPGRS